MTYQLTAPHLDACVLGIVAHEDTYGYTLTQKIRELVDVSDSTLYPVLRRLQKENCLETYDQPFQGRNRRYYRITSVGLGRLEYYRNEWIDYKEKVDIMLSGEEGSSDE
jgi:PadR family transcriptional regulator PadR